MNFSVAYNSNRPAEVRFAGTVTSQPSFFFGTHTQSTHEQFNVQTSAGPLQVVDNVALAPRVPVQTGDRVEVQGEMVHDPGRAPIVHWTHHDPSGRHVNGFIRYQGRTYA